MSGAPIARQFDVQFPDGIKRYTLEPRILSDATINRLRGVLMKRRRELRQQTIKDFAEFGKDLPLETKAAFAKEILADAKSDSGVPIDDIVALMESMDEEAIATLLWTCSPEIDSFDQAMEVMQVHGKPMEIVELLGDLMNEESDAAGNSSRHPVKESRGQPTKSRSRQ
jgi:hypothetical protein